MPGDVAHKLQKPGAVGVIPTDTVYGIVARAADRASVKRLYEVKKRSHKPGTIIAASREQLELLGLKHRYLKAVEQFWPGAVSIIIPASDPDLAYLRQGQPSLAVRIPKLTTLHELLTKTGPLLTSSANIAGEPVAVNVEQAKAYFGNQVDFYEDGGNLAGHQASTLIQIVDDAVVVLRQGAVKV
jgi:L-threonylcarbamoyladenylate synthase